MSMHNKALSGKECTLFPMFVSHIRQMQLRADFPSCHKKYKATILMIENVKKYILSTTIFHLHVLVLRCLNR
jgi:hypothetical protein